MSDISLRDYLAMLDRLAQEGSADEVLWHARHILQYYPKNVEAYRYVGRALTSLGRWDEAATVLRRVLSVLPNDKVAHRLLSEVNERMGDNDAAIWHMERAFEQDAGDSQLIAELQRLYREKRQIAVPRLQLTTAAVARQNIRAGAYDRALETLRSALGRAPARTDLRLLLAEALWLRGDFIDAAELSLDVLQQYPDSFEANRMLAKLWLDEGRPSDAQRYLNRVEAIDPYSALELVQNRSANDDSFVLPELDYQRRAQAEMVANRPDWLEGIANLPPSSDPAGEPFADSALAGRMLGAAPPSSPSSEETPWESDLTFDDADSEYALDTTAFESSTSPLDAASYVSDEELPDLSAQPQDSLGIDWTTGPSDYPNSAPSAEPDPLAWMHDSQTADDSAAHEADPLAWMRSSGLDVIDSPPAPAAADEEDVYEEEEPDPLAWLQEYQQPDEGQIQSEIDMRSTEEVPQSALQDALLEDMQDEEFPLPDFDNFLDDQPTGLGSFSQMAPPTMPLPNRFEPTEEAAPADAFNTWQSGEDLLDESLGLEALSSDTAEPPVGGAGVFLDVDEPTIDFPLPQTSEFVQPDSAEWPAFEVPQAYNPPSQPPAADDYTPVSDWAEDEEDVQPEPQPSGQGTGATGMLGWLGGMQVQDVENEPDNVEAQPSADVSSSGSTGMLDWLSSSDNPAYDAPPPEVMDDESTGSTGMLNWLSQNRPLPPTMPLASEPPVEEPAPWMAGFDEEPASPPADNSTEEMSSEAAVFDWLHETETASEVPAHEQTTPAPLDWESEIDVEAQAEPDVPAEMTSTPVLDDIPSWLANDTSSEAGEPAVPVAGDVWLNELFSEDTPDNERAEPVTNQPRWDDDVAWESEQSSKTEPEANPLEEFDFGTAADENTEVEGLPPFVWMSSSDEADAPEDEPLTPESQPDSEPEVFETELDWLAEVQHGSEEPGTEEESPAEAPVSAGAFDDLDWLASAEVEEAPEQPAAAAPGLEELDWLNAAAPEATTPPASEPPDDFSWLGGSELPEDEAEPFDQQTTAAVETSLEELDWLSAAAPEEAAAQPEPVMQTDEPEDDFDWLGGAEAEPEAEQPAAASEPAADDFDWLAEPAPVIPAAEPEPAPMMQADEPEDEFDWLGGAELEPEAEQTAAASEPAADDFDWLAEPAPVIPAAEPEPAPVMQTDEPEDEFDWLGGAEPEPEAEQPAAASELAGDDFDWLGEPAPESPAAEPEPAAVMQTDTSASEFDWLETDFETDPSQTEAPTAEAAVAASADASWLMDFDEQAEPIGNELTEEQAAPMLENANWLSGAAEMTEPAAIGYEDDESLDDLIDAGEEQALPDWMQENASVATTYDPTELDEEFDVESVIVSSAEEPVDAGTSDMPSWLTDAAPAPVAEDVIPEVELALFESSTAEVDTETASDDFEVITAQTDTDMFGSETDEAQLAEAFEAEPADEYAEPVGVDVDIAPAPNAPDWLNAMVPGLDIDYTAREEAFGEALEEETPADVEENIEPVPTMPEDHQWLNAIVEEESRADAPAAAATTRGPRFVFSQPPVWLRRLLDRKETPAAQDDDLPEWLR